MLIAHENLVAVGTDGLVDAVAVEEPVVKDGDEGVFFFHEPVVQVDPHHQVRWNEVKNACAL